MGWETAEQFKFNLLTPIDGVYRSVACWNLIL